jgi:hypothetical protein
MSFPHYNNYYNPLGMAETETTTKVLSVRTSKKELAEIFGYSDTVQLKDEIFTAEWLEVLGWTKTQYQERKIFRIEETRQIVFMLRVRKLL